MGSSAWPSQVGRTMVSKLGNSAYDIGLVIRRDKAGFDTFSFG